MCWQKKTVGEISMFVGLNKSVGEITMFVVCWFKKKTVGEISMAIFQWIWLSIIGHGKRCSSEVFPTFGGPTTNSTGGAMATRFGRDGS